MPAPGAGPANDVDYPVEVRVDARARRILLRVDRARATAILVLPHADLEAQGRRFLAQKRGWLDERLGGLPGRVAFEPGAVLPVMGQPHTVRHDRGSPDPFRLEPGEIIVGGRLSSVPRLVSGGLRSLARQQLAGRSARFADVLELPAPSVAVRDTRSRWGSCSGRGNLSFSWRLILAPEPVMDYVAAHEVAHLREMNHGPRFWRLVSVLMPGHGPWRDWLRREGAGLHRYG